MCGIVGLFLKDPTLEPDLGRMLSAMLVTMTDRGPDSAGLAIYGHEAPGQLKLTVQSDRPEQDFAGLDTELATHLGAPVNLTTRSTHAVLSLPDAQSDAALAALKQLRPALRVMGRGNRIEIYKEVGLPKQVTERFGIETMGGHPWHWAHPHGHGIRGHHHGRASVQHRP